MLSDGESVLPRGTGEPPPSKEVFVLGAGFSVAVSPAFQVTDKLGRQAVEQAGIASDRIPVRGFCGGNFETWLSLLAEDQPHLSAAENLENRLIFTKVVAELVKVLGAAERFALNQAPRWFYDFLRLAHYRRATLITLNYDTLVEAGVRSLPLPLTIDDDSPPSRIVPFAGRIRVRDVLDDFPPHVDSTGFDHDNKPAQRDATFRLIKLHGSLDWYWSYGDQSGATLRRVETGAGFGGAAIDPEQRKRDARGLEPFIIPPTATKSAYYNNPVTRQLWREASETMRHAERITLIGYSLPPADLVMSEMVAQVIRGRDIELEVVNPEPGQVLKHLENLGTSPTTRALKVEEFVSFYLERVSGQVVREIQSRLLTPDEDPELVVHWPIANGQQMHARVESVSWRAGTADVHLMVNRADYTNTRVGDGKRLSELVEVVGVDDAKGVKRLVTNGPRERGTDSPLVAVSWPPRGTSGELWLWSLR